MKLALPKLCVVLWSLGILAMAAMKGAFGLGPDTLGFAVAARVAFIGLIGYPLLGGLALRADERRS